MNPSSGIPNAFQRGPSVASNPRPSSGIYEERKPGQDNHQQGTQPLTDGEISIALDSDLLFLIDNITQELARTSTTTSEVSPFSNLEGLWLPDASPMNGAFAPSAAGKSPQWPDRRQQPHNAAPKQALSPIMSTASEADPLPQVLHALDSEPDACIVVVRRITRLGFKSNRILKTRFEQLGWRVKNVVLLPSRARGLDQGPAHARPSSMGFVVFETPKAAAECLAKGTVKVEGVDVLIQQFTRQYKPTGGSDVFGSN